jgi:CheY-like chemotaxis protein
VVITDQTMPGMTGAEMAVEMLKLRPESPTILCSGYSSAIDRDKARALGIRELR